MRYFVFGLVIFFDCSSLWAAACCSGGSSSTSLILSDSPWSISLAATNAFVVAESRSDGKSRWREDAFGEQVFGLVGHASLKMAEKWQGGIRFGVNRRELYGEQAWGLGDFRLHTAFEPFPLYLYSKWRPRMFLVGSFTFPMANSTYEVDQPDLESFGAGFYAPAASVIIQRSYLRWDYLLGGEAKYQFERNFERDKVDPGFVFSGTASSGYSWSDYRVGLHAGYSFEQEKSFSHSGVRQPSKSVWDLGVDLGWTINDQMLASLSYNDQSVLGPTRNVSLQRSIGLQFTRSGI